MLLTSSLGLGDFVFREKKKYTENFIYSIEFRRKMRPNYTFETKKPTKSASYQKPTKIWAWSQNGTRIKFKRKRLPRFTAKQPRMKIIINLKTNNYVINKKHFFLNVEWFKECWVLNDLGNVECWVLNVECWMLNGCALRNVECGVLNGCALRNVECWVLNVEWFRECWMI